MDIIPEVLPNELPLTREVKHAINLVGASQPPNHSYYRSSLKEHTELNQQVEELLNKGIYTRLS